jgi:hypothetical protein
VQRQKWHLDEYADVEPIPEGSWSADPGIRQQELEQFRRERDAAHAKERARHPVLTMEESRKEFAEFLEQCARDNEAPDRVRECAMLLVDQRNLSRKIERMQKGMPEYELHWCEREAELIDREAPHDDEMRPLTAAEVEKFVPGIINVVAQGIEEGRYRPAKANDDDPF